jgi:hypothetical protein
MRSLLPALAAVALGCAMPGAELAGTYTPHLVTPDGASSPVTGTTLTLRADGRFEQTGFPMVEGRWRLEKGEVFLQPERKAGLSPEEAGLSDPRYPEVRLAAKGGQLEEAPDGAGNQTVWKRG